MKYFSIYQFNVASWQKDCKVKRISHPSHVFAYFFTTIQVFTVSLLHGIGSKDGAQHYFGSVGYFFITVSLAANAFEE